MAPAGLAAAEQRGRIDSRNCAALFPPACCAICLNPGCGAIGHQKPAFEGEA